MKNRVEVVGAVIVCDGKVLCTQRSAKMKMPLLWEFPGGKVEEGESFAEALVREIDEELACRVEVGLQIARTSHTSNDVVIILNTFYCKLIEGKPIRMEHEDMRWIAIPQLDGLQWAPADIPTVEILMHNSI